MISGANRGIGSAIAHRLAEDGHHLSLGARRLDALEESVSDIDAARLLRCHYDAQVPGSAERWVSETVDRWSGVDVLVNNAGTLHRTGLEQITEDELDDMWQVNVKGPLLLTRLTLPHLRRCGSGRVVNVASMSGKRVKSPASPGYAMTKFAVVALSHATRQLGWEDGVRVTALCPGPVNTDMMSSFQGDPTTLTQPEDLADLVATVIGLSNSASVAEVLVNCQLEAWS